MPYLEDISIVCHYIVAALGAFHNDSAIMADRRLEEIESSKWSHVGLDLI
jgi:hypothetical protein